MKVKTADLIDLSLDWAVAVVDGLRPTMRHDYMRAKAAANNYKGDLAWHLEVTPNEPITVDEAGVTHVLRAYSEQWGRGGPIIDRVGIQWAQVGGEMSAWSGFGYLEWRRNWELPPQLPSGAGFGTGPTVLSAAMRCFVFSRLGDEVEIPDELV